MIHSSKFCDICRLPADVCGFSLFAERLLFIYEICERENFQQASCVLFSQNYTEEQNTQRRTETLSQPIAQSITANDGCNVL